MNYVFIVFAFLCLFGAIYLGFKKLPPRKTSIWICVALAALVGFVAYNASGKMSFAGEPVWDYFIWFVGWMMVVFGFAFLALIKSFERSSLLHSMGNYGVFTVTGSIRIDNVSYYEGTFLEATQGAFTKDAIIKAEAKVPMGKGQQFLVMTRGREDGSVLVVIPKDKKLSFEVDHETPNGYTGWAILDGGVYYPGTIGIQRDWALTPGKVYEAYIEKATLPGLALQCAMPPPNFFGEK